MTVSSINAVIVLHAFGNYSRGQMITDAGIIANILASGNASMVVQTTIQQHDAVGATLVQEH